MPSRSISEKEQAALKQFRIKVKDLIVGMDPMDAHDLNLLRWLRARDLNIEKAEEMFRKSMQWRKINNVDQLNKDLILDDYLTEKVPLRVGSYDRTGILVIFVPFGHWDLKKLIEEGYREKIFFHIFKLLEIYFKFKAEEDFKRNTITTCSIIFDFDQWSIKQVASQQVISWVMDFFRQFEANYPERLKYAYGVNIPKIFEIFWPLVNPFLSPHTITKCLILCGGPDKWRPKLQETIDPHELPSDLGGSDSAKYFVETRFGLSVLSMPRSRIHPDEEFLSVVVPSGDKFIRSFNLVRGNRLTWNFKTDKYDIGFEVLKDKTRMFLYAKADSHLWVQDGLVDVVEDGTYSLVFDNSYSRLRPKKLDYVIYIDEKKVSDEPLN